MAKIIDDHKILDARRNAVNIIETLAALETQWTNNQATIQALKTKIAADVAADTWVKQDFIDAGNALELKSTITAKRAVYKTALTGLKSQVNDSQYETEIQTEIDKL